MDQYEIEIWQIFKINLSNELKSGLNSRFTNCQTVGKDEKNILCFSFLCLSRYS